MVNTTQIKIILHVDYHGDYEENDTPDILTRIMRIKTGGGYDDINMIATNIFVEGAFEVPIHKYIFVTCDDLQSLHNSATVPGSLLLTANIDRLQINNFTNNNNLYKCPHKYNHFRVISLSCVIIENILATNEQLFLQNAFIRTALLL